LTYAVNTQHRSCENHFNVKSITLLINVRKFFTFRQHEKTFNECITDDDKYQVPFCEGSKIFIHLL